MKSFLVSKYPSIPHLRKRTKRRIPKFAFQYVDGGCNNNINLHRNTADIRKIQLEPRYLQKFGGSSIQKELYGHVYDAPFGIAPIGLQGLIWPGATEILATAANHHNIPFILSTVATASIEKVAELTDGKAWFQLYHPKEESLRDDLIKRCSDVGLPVLVILADVPTFGYRPKEIKNGLAIPPRMTLSNILQICSHPHWALRTLIHGQPGFETLRQYMPKGMSLRHLGLFMNRTFDGRLTDDRIARIRDKWKGKLVLKGVASTYDAEKAVQLGLDGIIVSNHGGRQLDHGTSTISVLPDIVDACKGKLAIMMDSGVRNGPDIACTLSKGADFVFLGRSFMYGVGALGKRGGMHTIEMLKTQFTQVMDQLCCERTEMLHKHITF